MTDESYKLPPDQHEAIFRRLEKDMLENSSTNESPRIVITGAQPGAGKSKLIEFAYNNAFHDRNPAVINGDDYRKAHPQHRQILKEDDKRFAERTDPDVRKWTRRLLDSAISNRRDIIFEGTMRNQEPIMKTISRLKEEGYQIDVLVMAVRSEVSRQGIISRYEDQKEYSGYGRWTPVEFHDEAYKNMPDTAAAIEKDSPIDSIQVYNRAGDLLYQNDRQDDIFVAHAQDAKAAIIKERTLPISEEEQKALEDERCRIIDKMRKRKATAKEILETKAVLLA